MIKHDCKPSVKVTRLSWSTKLCSSPPPDETWVGVYTLKDCYPVQETYTRNSSVTTSTRFFNLQLGISDPDVFTPPGTCQAARPERMAESDCWPLTLTASQPEITPSFPQCRQIHPDRLLAVSGSVVCKDWDFNTVLIFITLIFNTLFLGKSVLFSRRGNKFTILPYIWSIFRTENVFHHQTTKSRKSI